MIRARMAVALGVVFAASTALAQTVNPLPYPGQYDVKDPTNSPTAVVDMPLLSSTQPQFVNPLPIPVDLKPDKSTYPGWDYYEIAMKEVTGTAPFLSTGAPAGTQWLGLVDPVTLAQLYTPVWGYGQENMNGGPLGGAATYPAMNIRGRKGTPIKVKWMNQAPDQHLFCPQPLNPNWPCAIDRTLMGTKAVGPWSSGVNQYGSGQQPDNAMVVHFHGGEIPPNSDGFAELWFGNKNSALFYSPGNVPQDISPSLSYAPGASGVSLNFVRPIGDSMLYNYPMVNQASTLWYHDHALGKTRINVAAGPAGFFPINDDVLPDGTANPNSDDVRLWGAAPDKAGYVFGTDTTDGGNLVGGCSTAGILAGNCYDINVVFQDRDFNAPKPGTNLATINFPNGLNQAQVAPVPFQTPLTPGGNPTVHPQWVPEYFGTFPIVNGMAWPVLDVQPRKYRFHFLDGSNARCWNLKRSDGLPITVIGSDQGYLGAPVVVNKLLMCPGERYDVVLDFAGLAAGTLITLTNDAPAPFPKGITPGPGDVKRVLQFRVGTLKAPDRSVIPATLVTVPALPPTLAAPAVFVSNREMVLNEVLDATTLYPVKVQIDGKAFEDGITETPKKGTTETWSIINTTGDAHPIHLHLVKFRIVSRQTFDAAKYSAATGFAVPAVPPYTSNFTKLPIAQYLKGKPRAPAAYEAGWKDTAISYPGEVLTIVATWDGAWSTTVPEPGTQGDPLNPTAGAAFLDVTSGPYVWHCHIVDHEDNEMMRPVVVQP